MAYVDGYVLPIPKRHLAAYKAMARKAAKIFREHGAVDYNESAAEDPKPAFGIPFGKTVAAKPNEIVVFSWVVYKSRAHRDRVNKAVMADPRIHKLMDPKKPLFDCNRMVYGGFSIIVKG